MKLSEHFDLLEFTRSGTAARLGINNDPTSDCLINLKQITAPGMEKVRAALGGSILIKSGYRCPRLNSAVGGAPSSYHMYGLAADFDPPPGWTHDAAQHAIAAIPGFDFDLILEEKAKDGAHWLHLQFPKPGAVGRKQVKDAALDRQGGTIQRVSAG